MKNAFLLLTLVFMSFTTATTFDKGIIGTWNMEVNPAPYEFQKGKAIFYENDEELMVNLVFEYHEFTEIKVFKEDGAYKFDVEMDAQLIPVTLKLVDNELIGSADTGQGPTEIYMNKLQ